MRNRHGWGLLRAVAIAVRAGVRREHGAEAADELMEGLVLLRERGNRGARYWLCPLCDQKFHSGRDYLHHVELLHEELALQVRYPGVGVMPGARWAQ